MDIKKVSDVYESLSKDNLFLLADIYHEQVHFQDAAHSIQGWDNLRLYFDNLYANVDQCHFEIHDRVQENNNGFLVWTMHFSHPRLNKGIAVQVNGTSHLKLQDNKVIYHRDYFDMGEMIYQHIPVLGKVIKTINKRLGQ
ncbi:nuclear transport factor 2 family protein [Vibrio sp.]|nr:nuclear transport factor 2 family protein [Vibrio sp.]